MTRFVHCLRVSELISKTTISGVHTLIKGIAQLSVVDRRMGREIAKLFTHCFRNGYELLPNVPYLIMEVIRYTHNTLQSKIRCSLWTRTVPERMIFGR